MKEFKGTKGEWFAVNYGGFIEIQSTPYEASDILDEDKCKEAEFNAKLIIVAPEILNALQVLVTAIKTKNTKYNVARFVAMAETVIDKAL